MFVGISLLAHFTHVVPNEESHQTVLAEIAHAMFAGGWFFYVIQAATALILSRQRRSRSQKQNQNQNQNDRVSGGYVPDAHPDQVGDRDSAGS